MAGLSWFFAVPVALLAVLFWVVVALLIISGVLHAWDGGRDGEGY